MPSLRVSGRSRSPVCFAPLLAGVVLAACASGPSPEEQRLSHVVRARVALDKGDTASAIKEGEEMLAAFPDDPMAEHILIAALSHSTDPADLARRGRLLASAASRPAERGPALFARANARRESGDLAGALVDLDRLLAADGKSSQALALRAVVRAQQKDLTGALADYDRAVELSPTTDGLQLQRALLRIHMGDTARGEAELVAVAERNPEIPWPHLHLARVRLEQGRFAEALESAEKALRIRPNDPQLLLMKDEALTRMRAANQKGSSPASRPAPEGRGAEGSPGSGGSGPDGAGSRPAR